MAGHLNTPNKLTAVGEKNHRRLLLEFVKWEGANVYKNSYFNNAHIDEYYLEVLREIGPFEFIEIFKVVSKLNVTYRHFHNKMPNILNSENYLDNKGAEILLMCGSKERAINNSLSKFQAIAEFPERMELVKLMGKKLREGWKLTKAEAKKKKATESEPQVEMTSTFSLNEGEEMLPLPFDI